jgi:hypothetical protein
MIKSYALIRRLIIIFHLGSFVIAYFVCTAGFAGIHEIPEENQKSGIIKGTVIDGETKSFLPNVQVRLMGTPVSTSTDAEGSFVISDVAVGSYSLEFFCRLYITQSHPDVIVKSNRITYVHIELYLDHTAQNEEITVTASCFSNSEQTLSTAAFSYEEIRRAAGSAGDVSRIISGLPSIARVNDMKNSLVVRGGSPSENAFYVDNIELPNINHYPSQGCSTGVIGLLNVDFIRDVQFYSGGFSPQYGDRLSSVMNISFREGNREEQNYQFDLSMMGVGAVAEGPFPNKKGSWMLSARRSYIDLLIKLMGSGVPVTWSDYQGKLTYDISPTNKLTFLGILGIDKSGTNKSDAVRDRESFFGGLDTTENTFGINWFTIWGSRAFSNTSISQNRIIFNYDSYKTVTEELQREGKNAEQILILRNVNYIRFNDTSELSLGLEAKHIITDYDYFLSEYIDVTGNRIPSVSRKIHESSDRYAAFFNYAWALFPKMGLNLGIRADYYSYGKNTHFSPRLSFSYNLSGRTSIDCAAGIFYQQLPLVLLLQNKDHKSLKDPVSYHYVLGIRHLLTASTQLTLEVYNKEYKDFPLNPAQPTLFIFDEATYGGFFSEYEHLVGKGKARSYGIEFMIQKKLLEKLYGVIGISYFRTRYRDFDEVWHNRIYDNHFIFSIEGGYKHNKYWEFGLKWNYAGGTPYTPFEIETSTAANSGIFDISHINTKRLPAYHTLNLRVDKRFYFGGSNLIVYISVWNVFNRKNVAAYYWNTIENKPDVLHQWGILPSIGAEFEF